MNEIHFFERARQLIEFTGLNYDSISPTDVDGLIEYKDKAYVIFELKHNGAEMPRGQRLAFERMVYDFEKRSKKAIAIVAEHDVTDASKSVLAKDSIVRELYQTGERKWRPPNHKMTLKELIDAYIEKIKKK